MNKASNGSNICKFNNIGLLMKQESMVVTLGF